MTSTTPASQNRPDSRYVHRTNLKPGTPPYIHGQKQAAIWAERYHYLCAAANKEYTYLDNIPPDFSRGQLFPRQGLDFSTYKAYKLDPVTGIKLHPREDGTIHPGDIEVYVEGFRQNWKTREGGILYFVAEQREFWNMVLNYHSKSHTTGILEWDRLLDQLKVKRTPAIVPCMVSTVTILWSASKILRSTISGMHEKQDVWTHLANSFTTNKPVNVNVLSSSKPVVSLSDVPPPEIFHKNTTKTSPNCAPQDPKH